MIQRFPSLSTNHRCRYAGSLRLTNLSSSICLPVFRSSPVSPRSRVSTTVVLRSSSTVRASCTRRMRFKCRPYIARPLAATKGWEAGDGGAACSNRPAARPRRARSSWGGGGAEKKRVAGPDDTVKLFTDLPQATGRREPVGSGARSSHATTDRRTGTTTSQRPLNDLSTTSWTAS